MIPMICQVVSIWLILFWQTYLFACKAAEMLIEILLGFVLKNGR